MRVCLTLLTHPPRPASSVCNAGYSRLRGAVAITRVEAAWTDTSHPVWCEACVVVVGWGSTTIQRLPNSTRGNHSPERMDELSHSSTMWLLANQMDEARNCGGGGSARLFQEVVRAAARGGRWEVGRGTV